MADVVVASSTNSIVYPPVADAWATPPNLPEYATARETFSWQQAEALLKLPRANGVNQATICLDGHLEATDEAPKASGVMLKDKPALIWLSQTGAREVFTFEALSKLSNQFANTLQTLGVKKGERVFVFLERVPELYAAIFGILKLGAIAGPLFAAFGPEAILDRLADCEACVVITSPALKPRLDAIRAQVPSLRHVLVLTQYAEQRGENAQSALLHANDLALEPLLAQASDAFEVPHTSPDDPSVIHYTSGTTGKPKGALHRHGAVVAQSLTARWVLDLKPTDVYWCTADPGWVTGTSYGMFGPWSLGVTQVVAEAGFKPETWYQILQDEKITVWYTAPTAIRMLMKAGNALPAQYEFSALRHLASVGEPLNPEAITWGRQVFGGKTFLDTWWQTETGAMQIVNLPCLPVKPGSMGKPLPGVTPGILDDKGQLLSAGEEGHLVLRASSLGGSSTLGPDATTPGAITCDERHPSFFKHYWQRPEVTQSKFKGGWYYTGDRAWQDADGYYWFVGRDDDVINTAGHLVGPFEVESALVEHPAVAEAAVIGKPDPERLEIIKAFVSLKAGYQPSEALSKEIQTFVRTRLAAHAYPREIAFLESLPKTRSGKLMRRLLKARELGLPEGDTSTLEE
ncbi:MAG: acetate--CoA ligase [Vampirovibrionales bacterium]|nr:acetate--CoA ligase [Vampirovibrionales bacterium]